MFALDQEEKTELVHFVLVTSANIFFQEAHIVRQNYDETDCPKIHSEADEKHAKMSRELLRGLSAEKYRHLLEIQHQGWDMLNAVCSRIAVLMDGLIKQVIRLNVLSNFKDVLEWKKPERTYCFT